MTKQTSGSLLDVVVGHVLCILLHTLQGGLKPPGYEHDHLDTNALTPLVACGGLVGAAGQTMPNLAGGLAAKQPGQPQKHAGPPQTQGIRDYGR